MRYLCRRTTLSKCVLEQTEPPLLGTGEHLIGPYFIEGLITAHVLQEQFIPDITRLGLLYSAHLQQDGAPPTLPIWLEIS